MNKTRNNVRYVFECAACYRLFTRRRDVRKHAPRGVCGREPNRGAFNDDSPSSSSDRDDSESVTVRSVYGQAFNVHTHGALIPGRSEST